MATCVDVRPVSRYGSSRHSDKVQERSVQKSVLVHEARVRRDIAEDVCEEIEDFEHKMGWRMRSRLGPKGCERRAMERGERIAMGIKRPLIPRCNSPFQHYDYAVDLTSHATNSKQPAGPLNIALLMQKQSSWINSTRSGKGSQTCRKDPGTSLKAPLPRLGLETFRDSCSLWTTNSMIEPIFLPLSSSRYALLNHLMKEQASQESARYVAKHGSHAHLSALHSHSARNMNSKKEQFEQEVTSTLTAEHIASAATDFASSDEAHKSINSKPKANSRRVQVDAAVQSGLVKPLEEMGGNTEEEECVAEIEQFELKLSSLPKSPAPRRLV